MKSIHECFNAVASMTAGFTGAVLGADKAVDVLAQLTSGPVPYAVATAFLLAGAAVGGVIAYRGVKSILEDAPKTNPADKPCPARPTRPLPASRPF